MARSFDPKWQYLIPKGLLARRNKTLLPHPAAVALSNMAWAMVTQAGIPYSRWPATAPGDTRRRNCNCCGVKRGEKGESRKSKFEAWGAGGALAGFEFPFSIFVFGGEPAGLRGLKFKTWGAVWGLASIEFPFPMFVFSVALVT